MDMWRIITLETHDAFLNMALDEAASEAPPRRVQRFCHYSFYRWQPSAVSMAIFKVWKMKWPQKNAVKRADIRRRTGGGAVFTTMKEKLRIALSRRNPFPQRNH